METTAKRLDASELHNRLGTAEWCRRLDLLKPKRGPLIARADALQARLDRLGTLWWEWVAANEEWLPPPLREMRSEERAIEGEMARLEREMEEMWYAEMAP